MYAEGAGTLPVTTLYSDFRDVGGVRHPFRTVTSNDATGRTVFVIEAIERLETAEKESFEPPGASKAGGR
jgi:hypothetical protein